MNSILVSRMPAGNRRLQAPEVANKRVVEELGSNDGEEKRGSDGHLSLRGGALLRDTANQVTRTEL